VVCGLAAAGETRGRSGKTPEIAAAVGMSIMRLIVFID